MEELAGEVGTTCVLAEDEGEAMTTPVEAATNLTTSDGSDDSDATDEDDILYFDATKCG